MIRFTQRICVTELTTEHERTGESVGVCVCEKMESKGGNFECDDTIGEGMK